MKRTAIILFSLIMAIPILGQESQAQQPRSSYSASEGMQSRVFEIRNRDPRAIASSVALLGSGAKGSDLSVNSELNTITVRDFPENLATIEAAIRRLDTPSTASRGIRMQLYVLVGSNEPDGDGSFPGELEDVVRELKSALRYSGYSLMTSALHQTRAGQGIEGSGVADAALVNFKGPKDVPLVYSYSLRQIELLSENDHAAVDVRSFRFSMKMPIREGEGVHYIDVGFETPVLIREEEKVVVGTTAMGDKALVVVVTAAVDGPAS